MGDALLKKSGGLPPDKITAIAKDKVQIGDMVYTVNSNTNTDIYELVLNGLVDHVSISPDGTSVVICGSFSGKAKIYLVDGNVITYSDDIYMNNNKTPITSDTYCSKFSNDGSVLFLGCSYADGGAKIYSVNSDRSLTYVRNIYADSGTTAISNAVYCMELNPLGDVLFLGGNFSGSAKVYSVSGTDVTYVRDIYMNGSNTAFNSTVSTLSISGNGQVLIVGGAFTGRAKVYSVSGTTVTYVNDIYADSGMTALSSSVLTSAISHTEPLLVLGGSFAGRAKYYHMSGTTITYVGDLYGGSGTEPLDGSVYNILLMDSIDTMVICGAFTKKVKKYIVTAYNSIMWTGDVPNSGGVDHTIDVEHLIPYNNNTRLLMCGATGLFKNYSITGGISKTLTFLHDIYDKPLIGVNSIVRSVVFSPNGKLMVIGGDFHRYALLYSINDNVATFICPIYANNNNTLLNGSVYTATFSPNGSLLVLGGVFTGYCKLYSVSENRLTYISDIYANASALALNGTVMSLGFNPNGFALIVGGAFTGRAKVYSVSGTTITYVNDIYADSGTTALNTTVYSIAFANSTLLVIGGFFTGGAKIYSVSGSTTVTYVRNIYADSGTTALGNTMVVGFNTSKTVLYIGGLFSGYAKSYSVSGTNINYSSDIYADNNNTPLADPIKTISVSNDIDGGIDMVLLGGGSVTAFLRLYKINGNNLQYIRNLLAENYLNHITRSVESVRLSPNNNLLVIGGEFPGFIISLRRPLSYARFLSGMTHNQGQSLAGAVYHVELSSTGDDAILSGVFENYAKTFFITINGMDEWNYIQKSSGGYFTDSVYRTKFSPDRKYFVLTSAEDPASIYNYYSGDSTYEGPLYANSGSTLLSTNASGIAISCDSNYIVLIGTFNGNAKLYRRNSVGASYISDCYMDNNSTVFNGVISAVAFSPITNMLFIGGTFTGKLKQYFLRGNSLIYLKDVVLPGNTPLPNSVGHIEFSNDGKYLAICGGDSSSGVTIFGMDGLELNHIWTGCPGAWQCAFSSDSDVLIVSGEFQGYLKVYNIRGGIPIGEQDIRNTAHTGNFYFNNYINCIVCNKNSSYNSLVVVGDSDASMFQIVKKEEPILNAYTIKLDGNRNHIYSTVDYGVAATNAEPGQPVTVNRILQLNK